MPVLSQPLGKRSLLVLRMASCHANRKGGRLYSRKTRHPVVFAWPASAGWCCAWHPAMPIYEGGLPEHRSEHQAPRRQSPTIIPDAVAEPPSERSVFGEPARRNPRKGHVENSHLR
jgi:hypothetical protein